MTTDASTPERAALGTAGPHSSAVSALPSPVPGHLIVCGLGHVGYRVVSLLRRLGEPVVVLTQDARSEWQRDVEAAGARVIRGDARDHEGLREAGIERARALVLTMDQDLVSVEAALDAREMRPDIAVVMRLFDQTLARQFAEAFGIRHASATSELAAPAFAAAAMGEAIAGSFRLDSVPYVAGSLTVPPAGPLADLTLGQLAARYHASVLLHEREGAESEVAPSLDLLLRSGDRVTLLATAPHWRQLAGGLDGISHAGKKRVRAKGERVSPWLRAGRFVRRSIPLPLGLVFLALNSLILLSVFVFRYGMRLSPVDALYFVVTTVTTVGYGDITPRAESSALKIYGCLLMLLGSATIATLYSIITDLVVTARFHQLLGRHHAPQEGHTIVVGLGSVGYRVVEELRAAGTDRVGIERDADGQFQEAVRAHTAVVTGDGRLAPALQKAGIQRAAAVIAATDNDVVNLGVGLAAKQMNPRARTVVRLFDADFARKVQTLLSIDAALSASLIAAPTFAAAALTEGVCCAFVDGNRFLILVARPAGEEWAGMSPSGVRATHGRAILLRRRPHERGYHAVDDDTPLHADDHVLAMEWRDLR